MPRPRRAPDLTAVLSTWEMARWWKCTPRTVQRRFKHIPEQPGKYLVSDILEQIREKRRGDDTAA